MKQKWTKAGQRRLAQSMAADYRCCCMCGESKATLLRGREENADKWYCVIHYKERYNK